MSALLRHQIIAMRENARAVMATADAILAAISEAPVSMVIAALSGPCRHDPAQRLPVPRMGQPDAWLCACGVESGTGTLVET